jgi:hypothetical protein
MATWKKVIVSGSDAILNQLNVSTNQQIGTTQATTFLTGSFTGSFKGDGSGLTGVGAGTVESITAGTGLTGGTITGTGTIAIDTSVVATLTGTQTLSGKTLTLPTIGGTGAKFNGSTSGTTTVVATAAAGTNTLTLPATNNDTLVGKATTDILTNKTLTAPTITGAGAIAGVFTGNLTGNVTGNAATATSASVLTTGRTIAITGDLSYTSPSFNGSGNVTAAGTLATVNSNVGSFTNASVTVNAKGLVTSASSGTAPVTTVTGTSPVVSSGGTTPAISLASGYGDTQNPYASKTQKNFLAAPNATNGVPTFRTILASDIPTLNQNTTGNAQGLSGTPNITVGTVTATTGDFSGDLTVDGDLVVNGDLVTLNTANLAVEDRFILLNSGSSTATDESGIIFGGANGTANSGTALIWNGDYNSSDGRLAIAKTVAADDVAATPSYYVGGVFEGSSANAATAEADHLGNIRIENNEIFIFA